MNYFLVEISGETRQVWGPYPTFDRAKHEAGGRHFVAQGSGLFNGQIMTAGELHNKLDAGSVWPFESDT
jgi:hypothetical protein